jgi:hypothetical protein
MLCCRAAQLSNTLLLILLLLLLQYCGQQQLPTQPCTVSRLLLLLQLQLLPELLM